MRTELAELGPWPEVDPRVRELRAAIASRVGATAEEIVIGQGAAALFGAAASAFGVQQSRAPASAMAVTPSLPLYKWAFRSRGVKLVEVPLDAAFGVNWEMMERAIASMRPNILVLGAPNDPTGVALDAVALERVLPAAETLAGEPALVIVDESAASPSRSLRALRASHPSVAIVRTLGAASGVAWLEMDASLARELGKMPGFTPDGASLATALAAVEKGWDDVAAPTDRAIERGAQLASRIAALEGWNVTPTTASFVWAEAPCDAGLVVMAAESAGVPGLSGGGVGRLARRLRIEAPADEAGADRVVELLRSRAP